MIKVLVDLGAASYEIFIGENILKAISNAQCVMRNDLKFNKALVVTQKNILDLCEEKFPYEVALIPEGETSKSLQEAEKIFTRAIEAELDRKSVIIALGGGVVGDLAGFVAATFMRGINLIQIPTTLLAQVDSSVGGKTAVNHALGKNLIGAFHQPKAVFIDLNFLKTLPEREIKSGLGEIVKYGVISDEKFFSYLEDNADKILQRDLNILAKIVKHSCEIKAKVVSADEKESGLRRILNFGHTLALAIGIMAAALISCELGKTSAENVNRIESLLKKFGMMTNCAGLDSDKLYSVTFRDKKTVGGVVNWVLMRDFGSVEVSSDVPENIIKKVFRRLCNGN